MHREHHRVATLSQGDHTSPFGIISDTILTVASVEKLLRQMRNAVAGVRYADLAKVCEAYFGAPRQQGSSHAVYKMPWPGDPRVNIQNDHGKAKPYQVKQVLAAIDRLEKMNGTDKPERDEDHG